MVCGEPTPASGLAAFAIVSVILMVFLGIHYTSAVSTALVTVYASLRGSDPS